MREEDIAGVPPGGPRAVRLLLLLLLVVLSAPVSSAAAESSVRSFVLELELLPEQNAVRFTETYFFFGASPTLKVARGRFPGHRVVYLKPVSGRPLVKQQLSDVEVHQLDATGSVVEQSLDFVLHEIPNDRVQIDFDYHPPDWNGVLRLAYTLSGVTRFDPAGDRVVLSTWPDVWDLPYEETTLVWRFPGMDVAGLSEPESEVVAWDDDVSSEAGWNGGRYVETWSELREPIVLRTALTLPTGVMNDGGGRSYLQALASAGGPSLIVFLLMVFLAPFLRFTPPRISIGVAAVWNIVLALAFCSVLGPDLLFWVLAEPGPDRFDWYQSVASQVLMGVLLMGLALFGTALQSSRLVRGHPDAWTTQLAVPMGFSVMVFFAGLVPGFLFVFSSAWLMLIFWVRRPLTLYMGADLGPVVEHVVTEGRVRISEVASRFGMTRAHLSGLLRDRPDLPLATDHDADMVYSSATLAAHAELSCCVSCGGATTIVGMESVACPYCGRSRTASEATEQLPPPVPHLVETIRNLLIFLGRSVSAFAVAVACIFLLLSVGDDEWGAGVAVSIGVGAIGVHAGRYVLEASASLRPGTSDSRTRRLLWLGAPLILPLFALREWNKPRVRLHFGDESMLKPLRVRLARNGELSLTSIAELLQAPYQEAAELARSLTASGELDAVYDRQCARVVSRSAYRELARQGSCLACGGLLRVGTAGLVCRHCGASATGGD